LQVKPDATQLTREFFWSAEKGKDRFQLLIDQGLVEATGDGTYRLANWEEYRQR
jgi:hypothetical protein